MKKERGGFELGPAWAFFLVPVLGLAAMLSLPYVAWRNRRSRQQERLFVAEMYRQRRVVHWNDLESGQKSNRGLIAVEWLSFAGPVRWWWLDSGARSTLQLLDQDLDEQSMYAPVDPMQWETQQTGVSGNGMLIIADIQQRRSMMDGPHRFKDGVNALLVAPFLSKDALEE